MELDYNRDYSLDIANLLIKWLRNDYHTPKVKAEVIIDMLVSEFVTGMIDQKIKGSSEAVLLAKEFPIKGYSEENGRFEARKNAQSPAVDYLVKKGETLYLVELKTDPKSFEHEQIFRMLMTRESGSEQMFKHYADVLISTGKETREKYRNQANNLLKMSGIETEQLFPADLKKGNENGITERFAGLYEKTKNIEVIYLIWGELMNGTYKDKTRPVYEYIRNDTGSETKVYFTRILKDGEKYYVNQRTKPDLSDSEPKIEDIPDHKNNPEIIVIDISTLSFPAWNKIRDGILRPGLEPDN